jgi:TusA-related sulfurtransferase
MTARVLVTLGMQRPRPLFEVDQLLKTLEKGERVEVIADDLGFEVDICAWCRRTGHLLCDLRRDGHLVVVLIEKR